jgi:hypothetical protein
MKRKSFSRLTTIEAKLFSKLRRPVLPSRIWRDKRRRANLLASRRPVSPE